MLQSEKRWCSKQTLSDSNTATWCKVIICDRLHWHQKGFDIWKPVYVCEKETLQKKKK